MADSRSYDKSGQSSPPGNESLGDTFMGIIKDVQGVIRGEIQLAKTEIKEDVSKIGKAVAMIGAGIFFGLIGFIFLMHATTYLINQWIEELWISAGIVAVALLVIAAIIAMAGKSKLSKASLKPDQTIGSLKEDQQWANQQIKSVKK